MEMGIWFGLCIAVGLFTKFFTRDSNFWSGFAISLLLTPVVAMFAVLTCEERKI